MCGTVSVAVQARPVGADLMTSSHRTKVLVVVGNLDVGGVEMDIVRNMPRLDREKFEISVYAFMGTGELAGRLVASGIDFITPATHYGARSLLRNASHAARADAGACGASRWSTSKLKVWMIERMMQFAPTRGLLRLIGSASFMLRIVLPLARHIRQQRIDIVHCFLPHAYVVGGLAAILARGPRLVVSRVSSNFYMNERPIYRFMETRILHKFAAAIICNSQAIRRELIGENVPEDRIVKLYNGIDLEAFAPSSARRRLARQHLAIGDDELVVTCVANLFPYKRHDDLIAALALIRAQLPQRWRLVCAGRDVDDRRAMLMRTASELGIGSHVTFPGSIENVPELLSASDLHVHPSSEEGLPNSILEAMASRLPIVATTVGGIPELVVDGEGGWLVPPCDIGALARALAAVVSDEARRTAMGRYNRDRAAALFPIDSSVRGYEDTYRRLMYGNHC